MGVVYVEGPPCSGKRVVMEALRHVYGSKAKYVMSNKNELFFMLRNTLKPAPLQCSEKKSVFALMMCALKAYSSLIPPHPDGMVFVEGSPFSIGQVYAKHYFHIGLINAMEYECISSYVSLFDPPHYVIKLDVGVDTVLQNSYYRDIDVEANVDIYEICKRFSSEPETSNTLVTGPSRVAFNDDVAFGEVVGKVKKMLTFLTAPCRYPM